MMAVALLPNKYVPVDFSAIGLAALLLDELHPNDTVSSLWDRVSEDTRIRTFDRFAEALTLLYAAKLVEIDRGILRPAAPATGAK